MKKSILFFSVFISLCFLSKISYSQSSGWIWAKSAGGTNNDAANSIAVDALGNVYVVGCFSGSHVKFGSIVLTNTDTNSYDSYFNDIFLAKYDVNGNILWAKSAGGIGDDYALSIAVDASGNAFITGYFESSSITFDTTILTGTYGGAFLVKYDTYGNVLWANGISSASATSVVVDALGNSYITGGFSGSIISFGSTTLYNADNTGSTSDLFLAKYNSNGNLIWAKSAGGTNNDEANSIAVDALGNIYITGIFSSSTITFGTTILSSFSYTNGYNDIFLAKYDINGNPKWAKSAGGMNYDKTTSIATDTFGNVYITGWFDSYTINFDSIILTNATTQSQGVFLAKYNSFGGVIWAKSAGGNGAYSGAAYSVAIDASSNAYVTGLFISTIIFGSITLFDYNNTGHSASIFLAKYNSSGNVLWAKSVGGGGTNGAQAYSVTIDAIGNSFIAGCFDSPNLSFGSITLTNADYTGKTFDIFLAKLGSGTGINELNNSINISLFPNPTTDNISINVPQKSKIEISNLQGQIIKRIKAERDQTTIDISTFTRGMYFIKVTTDKEIITKKFIKE